MASIDHGRPDTTEYIPYFARYIALVPEGVIVAILDQQMEDIAISLPS